MITFTYPGYESNPDLTTSVTLGSPERGDNRVSLEELILHPTEAGSFKSNTVISCLGEFERSLSFTGICNEEKNNFLSFIQNATGHYIKYTDYDNVSWITQITDNEINISNDPFGWSIDLALLVWEAS